MNFATVFLIASLSTSPANQSAPLPKLNLELSAASMADMLTPVKLPALKMPSRDTRFQRILRASILGVAAGLDVHSTYVALKMPGMVEKNSLLYGRHPSLFRLVVTKAALNGVGLLGANEAAKKSRVDALIPIAIAAAKQAFAAVMNYKLIGKVRAR